MDVLQDAKRVVLAHFDAIASASSETMATALAKQTAPDWHWRGMHPFHEQHGAEDVAEVFWSPLSQSLTSIQRRQDVFFSGKNMIDDFEGVWVVSMGHLLALFDQPFLGIPPTRKIVMLRYAEFNRVDGGKIVETGSFFDLLHLMAQAGIKPIADQTATHLVQPGPATHDGLLYQAHPVKEGEDTLDLINRMIGDINANSNSAENEAPRDPTPQDELNRCWHDDMLWWGPEGIGATYTIDRYIEQHQKPFRTQLSERVFNGHIARLAEGNYGGFFGWPNLTLRPIGNYLGQAANTETTADMRVVDIYRRDGDKLAENWVFIDILHFLKMQGVDVLDDLTK